MMMMMMMVMMMMMMMLMMMMMMVMMMMMMSRSRALSEPQSEPGTQNAQPALKTHARIDLMPSLESKV